MKGKIFLVLLVFALVIGVQSVFAQSAQGESGEKAAAKETVKKAEPVTTKATATATATVAAKKAGGVININLASDDEFNKALGTATEVELVNEEAVKKDESSKNSKQGSQK